MNKQMTVWVGDYEVAVRGDYQPPERMTREYPGCDASFEVDGFTATLDGQVITDQLPGWVHTAHCTRLLLWCGHGLAQLGR